MRQLPVVIEVNKDKCVNCHACIAACPVKFCNDGSGEYVKLNSNACIGCGACIAACTHEARTIVDDAERFFKDLKAGQKMVAVAAPAVAVSFPNGYLRLNSWLKSSGVDAIFDVSFGAELTVKTYLDHVAKNNPKAVIAQPCPAIVSYIEIYKPELLPYLAPADSPMLHTVRMIREYYPQYKNHKVVVLSPCIAKSREFAETGQGDYNVTFANIQQYIAANGVRLESYPETDYDNPPAERAVLFSTPGGLMRTAMREVPGIEDQIRKIEGTHVIYKYLDELPHMIKQGKNPLLIDCLNCELGCNGGTGTNCKSKPQDEVEWLVEQRSKKMKEQYAGPGASPTKPNPKGLKKLRAYIDKYWKPGLYGRSYVNLAENAALRQPSESDIQKIYGDRLLKTEKKDELNCGACGYGSCRSMAVALHNGLSREDHCAKYTEKILQRDEREMRILHEEREEQTAVLQKKITRLLDAVTSAKQGDLTKQVTVDGDEPIDLLAAGVKAMLEDLSAIIEQVASSAEQFNQASQAIAEGSQGMAEEAQTQNANVEEVSQAIVELSESVRGVHENAQRADSVAKRTSELAVNGGTAVQKSIDAMHRIHESSRQIGDIIQVISEIARQTNLLALNAAIEAARAGTHGLGFAVVADEVRKLAERSNKAAQEITVLIKESTDRVEEGGKLSQETGDALRNIIEGVRTTAGEIAAIAAASVEQASNAEQVAKSIDSISQISEKAAAQTQEMASSSQQLSAEASNLGHLVSKFQTA